MHKRYKLPTVMASLTSHAYPPTHPAPFQACTHKSARLSANFQARTTAQFIAPTRRRPPHGCQHGQRGSNYHRPQDVHYHNTQPPCCRADWCIAKQLASKHGPNVSLLSSILCTCMHTRQQTSHTQYASRPTLLYAITVVKISRCLLDIATNLTTCSTSS